MANQCEVIEEQGFMTITPNPSIIMSLSDVATVSNVVSGFRSYLIAQSMSASDALSYVRGESVDEQGTLAGTFSPVGQPFYVASERGRISNTLTTRRGYAISEAMVGADALSFIRFVLVAEQGAMTSSSTPVRLFNTLVREQARASTTLSAVRAMVLSEAGVLADTPVAQRGAVLAELGVLAATVLANTSPSLTIEEVGQLAAEISQLLHAQMIMADEGFMDADASTPGQGAGWTSNTDTWAMSRYTNMTFNSLVVLGDVLHGAADDGLYALDAADDAGAAIDAGVDTAVTDMASPTLKSLGYAYYGGLSDGEMMISATSAQGANKLTYTYLFENKNDGMGYAPMRAKLGRGIESRYWSFGLRNRNGSYFSMDDLIVLFDAKSRKV